MSRMADYYCDKYRYWELGDFAYNCGIDVELFDSAFWDALSLGYNEDKTFWIIYNWLDCEGEIDIEELANDYDRWYGGADDREVLCSNTV